MIKQSDLKTLSHEEKDQLILSLISRITDLEERLNKNSSNSSKPPSSDIFKKQKKSKKESKASKRRSGGQPGHKGTTCKMSDSPDTIIKNTLECCPNCQGKNLKENEQNYKARQVHDIVMPQLTVTEYQCTEHICQSCGEAVFADFPEKVSAPVKYGVKLSALIVYLKNYQLLPYKRIKELLSDQFNVKISEGTIANIESKAALEMDDCCQKLKEYLINVPVLHSDETGVRSEADLFWNHVYSTREVTYFSIHKNRGKIAMNDIGILPKYKGVLINDFLSSYYTYDEINHGACNAHILRELKAEQERGNMQAQKMISLLVEIKKAVDDSLDNKVSKKEYLNFRSRYRRIINQAIKSLPEPEIKKSRGRPKKGKSRCLWERLLNYENEILLFSEEALVPFDNNQAERDLRMCKVKMKISGCFRNQKSADHFSIIRSVISTIKKQGNSVLDGIVQFMQGLNPDILPE